MFTIEMLPARQGDCLWIEFGNPDSPNRILIDGGVFGTYDFITKKLSATGRFHIDLLIITHIDRDHIGGILRLLQEPPKGLSFGDIWFNGWAQLVKAGRMLGPIDAERVGYLIDAGNYPHNEMFDGGPVVVTPGKPLPVRKINGMKITLLSPTPQRLAKLKDKWEEVVRDSGRLPGEAGEELERERLEKLGRLLGKVDYIEEALAIKYAADNSVANGSSIAALLEFEDKRLLCLGDAFAEDVLATIAQLCEQRGRELLTVEATKLSHHAGKSNTSIALIEKLFCSNWLISTDGSGNANHPHAATLARIIRYGQSDTPATLVFNYLSTENEPWRSKPLQKKENFTSVQPDSGSAGIVFSLV